MLQDLRFAVRVFSHSRAFFATAVLTIALGVGLSATVFAVVDGVLFRSLPYRDPSQLVAIYGAVRAESDFTLAVSLPDLTDWRASARSLQALEGYDLDNIAQVRGTEETTQVRSASVTAGFFKMLGVRTAFGRGFADEDFGAASEPVAIVTYRVWRELLGGAPDVLSRTIESSGRQYAIVGVLPEAFVFPAPQRRFAPDVILPASTAVAGAADRTFRSWWLIGRRVAGASVRQVQTELDGIALRLKPQFVGRPNLRPGAFDGATVMDLRDQLTRQSRGVLWFVFGAAATVFVIACLNVLGLLIAQAEDRRRELAVRTAIGASRAALVRQQMVETTLIVAAGGAFGWVLAEASFAGIARRVPQWMQLLGDPRLNDRALVFTALIAALTLLAAGILPLLRAPGISPQLALAGGGRHGSTNRRGRHVLLMVQVALATVLLCCASIMLRSWVRLSTQESGMDAERVIGVRAAPPGVSDAASRTRFNDRMAEAIRRVAGVQDVAFVDMPLLQSAIRGSRFIPPARVPNAAGMDTDLTVSENYFQTMGVPIRAGRRLTAADRGTGVVVSETLARRYWPGRSPVGETIRYGDGTRVIVGVAADARDVSFDRPPAPTLYHVWDDRHAPNATFIVRFSGPKDRAIAGLRRAVRETDPAAAVTMLSTVEDLLSISVAPRAFNTLLFGVFGAAGLAVALVGIYGLVAFLVTRREREMGIRLALGATGRALKIFVVFGILRWVAAGIAIGLSSALLFVRDFQPFVYHVAPNDPVTLALVAAGFVSVAAAASYLPARRAARVDPVIALRTE